MNNFTLTLLGKNMLFNEQGDGRFANCTPTPLHQKNFGKKYCLLIDFQIFVENIVQLTPPGVRQHRVFFCENLTSNL